MKKITIVGGGVSGLTVGYLLAIGDKKPGVSVLEADSRPGGKIWSDRADGFLCEKGANGFLDNKPKTLGLCDSLGITPLRANENAKKRYVYFNETLNSLPESPPSFLKSKLISWPGKLRMAYEVIAPKGPEDETVADFILRRLGSEALEKLIDPMVSGVFAGDPYKMSIKSCFPRIKELEQEYGSLIRALIKIKKERKREKKGGVSVAPPGRLTSFHDGAQALIEALVEKLGDRVKTETPVKGIEKSEGLYKLHTAEGIVESDKVVFACPAYTSASILKDFDGEISDTLADIPYPSLSVVCFGYRKEKVGHALDGFGFLIPHREGRRILGTLWDSSIFPNRAPEGHVLLRTMIGGAQSPELGMLDDDTLMRYVLEDLKPIVSLKGDPDMVRIYRWERAIPQYGIDHQKKLAFIEERLQKYPGLYITGNAYRGVGINDCVENSYRIADQVLSDIG
ncbi:MAG: protoporphyrinogen oxidase [Nitrospiraceae bacterium]|nr:MAG: protoporphyrinogen oxidase [Nitrospiraceae bacterium]